MNKDFSKYQKIIDEFSGQVPNSDFEARFNAVTKSMTKTESFLLKMELKRLAAPCSRLIDLRGHVDGECKAFEHEERIHFLDRIASVVFTEIFSRYGGYTIGVYEAVMNTENNFRVIYQKEKSKVTKSLPDDTSKIFEKSQFPAQFFRFGIYNDRAEERMNFVIPIKISLVDERAFECSTSDISINGCKFRINDLSTIKIGQKITLRFTGLEEQYQLTDDSDLIYEVKNVTILDNMQLVGVKRVTEDLSNSDSFSKYLISFIHSNKRRYKINLDNTISALQTRSFEQFVMPKSNELPVFIERNDKVLTPKYALTCNNNQDIYQYWQDENHYSTLYCLISQERIIRLKKLALSGKSLLVFSFIHKSKGKSYFYTADEIQLSDDPEFMQQFLGFSASKAHFSVSQLSLLDVDTSCAESHFTLSNSITQKNEYLNAPVSDEVKTLLAKIPYIVVVSDITQDEMLHAYKALSYEGINTVKLKRFGHKRLSKPFSVDEVGINYRNQRQELRFTYKTPANIKIDNVISSGSSLNFSTSGLKIVLDKATTLVAGDIVHLGLPKLQQITSVFDLTGLPYEVIRVNRTKTIVNLRVYIEKHQHIGRKFFKALIDKNRHKLTSDEYAQSNPGLAKALRNIYSASSKLPTLVVQTSGSRYKSDVIASGDPSGKLMAEMAQLSDRKSYYNLYPILGHADFMNNLTVKLKKMQNTETASSKVLYIAINPSVDRVDKAVTIKLSAELDSEELKQSFIHQALKNGQFFCVLMKLSRAAGPDMNHLNPELSYISSYAIHRGKQIEQEIWSVAGIAQIFDITQEVIFRYRLMRKN
ncbi:PilZ domain-containing protein [Colwellia sp. PAMC 21821]|uniref:PilZ domain-containing protein n=1 Tax=Colwellia sp. PAMC 21821 TaxID=1816219 RepID=UPI0009C0503A|nr:PilZ domain-containing protein [Colwellia sp. PAMC 21821]ARD45334.1 hypothetical protein A3Q33_14155 [Colwellia sp. PAMC 21821]